MKPKRTMSANILLLGIMSLLMVGSFVGYQIYSAITRSQISKEQEISIKPLDGSIKAEVVNHLKSRRWFNESEINEPIWRVIEATKSAVVEKTIEEQ